MHKLVQLLGQNWDFFVNDSSDVGRGNNKRMAFVYNKNKVFFRNLIGELFMDSCDMTAEEPASRAPFFASFQAGWFKFTLCGAHIMSKDDAGRPSRAEEIEKVASDLCKRAAREDEVYVFLGDMNTDNRDYLAFKAVIENGFIVPDFPPSTPRERSADDDGSKDRYYDLIGFAWPDVLAHRLNHGTVN